MYPRTHQILIEQVKENQNALAELMEIVKTNCEKMREHLEANSEKYGQDKDALDVVRQLHTMQRDLTDMLINANLQLTIYCAEQLPN